MESVAVAMSPVERTAAWVLNNGQYEEKEEEEEEGGAERSREEGRNTEKVKTAARLILTITTYAKPVLEML